KKIRKYSQHFIDLVDLQDDLFKTLAVRDVITDDYPVLRYLVSVDKGGYLAPLISRMDADDADDLVLTFEQLLGDRQFITLMKAILATLECHYKWPVDIEFAVDIQPEYPNVEYTVNLLQCRPLVSQEWTGDVEIPKGIPEQDVILTAYKLIPQGVVSKVRYIVYIDPVEYSHVPDYVTRLELARVVGRLNKRVEDERFILMGPGRWGSSNLDLGVKVTYADIYNTLVLVEIPLIREGSTAEASYGTHFFQDLVEAGIFPLPVIPGEDGAMLNTRFLTESPNVLVELLPVDAAYARYVRVIDVPAVAGGRYLEIVMDGEHERAVGYLKPV
ncbi:MAG: PEP/pyruvate-binding domain-containing protein, partial [Anaerolineae bacterium]